MWCRNENHFTCRRDTLDCRTWSPLSIIDVENCPCFGTSKQLENFNSESRSLKRTGAQDLCKSLNNDSRSSAEPKKIKCKQAQCTWHNSMHIATFTWKRSALQFLLAIDRCIRNVHNQQPTFGHESMKLESWIAMLISLQFHTVNPSLPATSRTFELKASRVRL